MLLKLLLLVSVAAQGKFCAQDKPCTSDTACVDTISSQVGDVIQGYCCAGKCVSGPPLSDIGQFCNASAGRDKCQPACLPQSSEGGYSLMCGSRNVCIPRFGTHCNCSTNTACASYSCSSGGQCLASTGTLANNASCLSATECISGTCTGGVCVGRPQESSCQKTAECAANLSCFEAPRTIISTCKPLCTTGTPNCCSANDECATAGDQCMNYTCTTSPKEGEQCFPALLCNSTQICAPSCNMTGCYLPSVCQKRNTLPLNLSCSTSMGYTEQCVAGTWCTGRCSPQLGSGESCYTSSQCQSPLICSRDCRSGNCTSGQICQSHNTIADGQPCDSHLQCANTSQCITLSPDSPEKTCVPLGGIPNLGYCGDLWESKMCAGYNDTIENGFYFHYTYCDLNPANSSQRICIQPGTLNDGAACSGSWNPSQCKSGICVRNSTTFETTCRAAKVISNGDACDVDDQCVSGVCAGASATNNTLICKAADAVPENAPCVDSRECSDYTAKYARCTRNVCVVYLGRNCTSDNRFVGTQCGDLYCACSGKCSVKSTVEPTPSPPRCVSQGLAWEVVNPKPFAFQFPEDTGTVFGSNLTKLLDYYCCLGCSHNPVAVAGWTINCGSLTATYNPSCNPSVTSKMFQGCTTTSGAPAKTGLSMLFYQSMVLCIWLLLRR